MRPRSGREAAAGLFGDIQADFEVNSLNPHTFLEGDGCGAAVVDVDITINSTGKRVHDDVVHFFEFGPDGKVTSFRNFLDTAKAIEAHS